MDKMLTMSLLVLTCSIVVFFSQEFSDSIKKIIAIRGMKLFLPLLVVTALFVVYEAEIVWVLTNLQGTFLKGTEDLVALLPFQWLARYVVYTLILMIFPFVPVLVINYYYTRKTYNGYKHVGVTIALIWLFIAALLIT